MVIPPAAAVPGMEREEVDEVALAVDDEGDEGRDCNAEVDVETEEDDIFGYETDSELVQGRLTTRGLGVWMQDERG